MRIDVDHQVSRLLVSGKTEEVLGDRQRLLCRHRLGADVDELLLQLADVDSHHRLRDVLALVVVPEVGELAFRVLELIEDRVRAHIEDDHLCEREQEEKTPCCFSGRPVAEELHQRELFFPSERVC